MRDAVAYAAGSAALLLGALGAGAGALGHVAWLAWTGSLVAVVGGCVAGAAVVAIEDMRGPTSGRGSAGHTDGAQADARCCAGGEAGGKPERPKPARDARRERK